jgi:hypothetical protein
VTAEKHNCFHQAMLPVTYMMKVLLCTLPPISGRQKHIRWHAGRNQELFAFEAGCQLSMRSVASLQSVHWLPAIKMDQLVLQQHMGLES